MSTKVDFVKIKQSFEIEGYQLLTTNWELRKRHGYNRIWDCGNLRFIKVNA